MKTRSRRDINVLRRRWKLLVGCVLSVLAATALLLAVLAPHYTANTQILLDPRKQNVIQSQQVVQGVALDTGVVESEVSILQSFGIARRVTERLESLSGPGVQRRGATVLAVVRGVAERD